MKAAAQLSLVLLAKLLASGCADGSGHLPPRLSRAYSVWYRYDDGARAFSEIDRRLQKAGFAAGVATTNGVELLSRYAWPSTSGIECTLHYEANGQQYELRLHLQCPSVDSTNDAAWTHARSSARRSWTDVMDEMPVSEKQ